MIWTHQPMERINHDQGLPDMRGKVVVMNQGSAHDISEKTSMQLINLGAKVYILSQNLFRTQGVYEKDMGDHCMIECDMTNLQSVKQAAERFLACENQLNLLFVNAQVGNPTMHSLFGVDQTTEQGHEYHMGINVLCQHLLIQLLKPALIEAAYGLDRDDSRIIFTTPQEIPIASSKLFTDRDPTDEGGQQYNHYMRCVRSRLATYHEAQMEADRLSCQGVIVTLVPPINYSPDHQKPHDLIHWKEHLKSFLWPSHSMSMLQLHAALAPIDKIGEVKVLPWSCPDTDQSILSFIPDLATVQKTWEWCEDQTSSYQTGVSSPIKKASSIIPLVRYKNAPFTTALVRESLK